MTRTTDEAPRGEEFRVRAARGLPADEVRRLSALSPWRSTGSLVSNWGVIAAAMAVAVRWPHPAVVAAAVIVIAGGQHGLAILTHQAAHYRMYRTRWLNEAAGKLTSWPMGLSMLTYRIIHRIHHNHLYEDIDPDLALMAGYPRGRMYLIRKLVKDLFGITTLKNIRYFKGGTVVHKDDTSQALRAAARRDRRIALAVYLAIVALTIATGTWRWFLLLWVLPLTTVLQVILRLRAVCEHGAVTDTGTPLRAARTTLAPLPVRWLLFPHQMHYHIEHHLYPSVPHYRLPECHEVMMRAGLLEGAEVSPTFRGTLRKIFAERQTLTT